MANKTSSNGIGIGTILFLIFMTLKLTGSIDWSWWWVTSPLWIPITLGIVIISIIGFVSIWINTRHK